jgi:hypothetical protein
MFMRAMSCSFFFHFVATLQNRSAAFSLDTADLLLLRRARRVFGLALVDQKLSLAALKPVSGNQTSILERRRPRLRFSSPGNQRCGYELGPLTSRTAGIEPATSCFRKRSTAEVTLIFATDDLLFSRFAPKRLSGFGGDKRQNPLIKACGRPRAVSPLFQERFKGCAWIMTLERFGAKRQKKASLLETRFPHGEQLTRV